MKPMTLISQILSNKQDLSNDFSKSALSTKVARAVCVRFRVAIQEPLYYNVKQMNDICEVPFMSERDEFISLLAQHPETYPMFRQILEPQAQPPEARETQDQTNE